MPPAAVEIVRAAYGDGTGHIFLISAGIAAVGVIATLFLTPVRLRDSVDLTPGAGGTDDRAPLEKTGGTAAG
ncbi:hypothetical protein GCM10010420_38320 [Streptomyces glaucosporus]|uniref:Major facilitator superfamily (MFS) profile domain-containing protein n=1 Tax=Streptomyces glaucosporus TaxID=284044 RepID=A0ABP5VLZ7_9ACTN